MAYCERQRRRQPFALPAAFFKVTKLCLMSQPAGGLVSVHGHHGRIPSLAMASTGTGFTHLRLPLHVALMRIRYSRVLLHTSLWEHPPPHSPSLDQPTCPWTRSGCPCGQAGSVLRCHVLLPCQELWVQVSRAVTAAHLLPGESPRPSICEHGCVW